MWRDSRTKETNGNSKNQNPSCLSCISWPIIRLPSANATALHRPPHTSPVPLDTPASHRHHCSMENLPDSFDPASKIIGECITFDDVLLLPQRSDFIPA